MTHENLNLPDILKEALAGAQGLTPDDRDAIAVTGALLETAACEAPDEQPLLQAGLRLVLETLEGVYLSELASPAQCLAAANEVLVALYDWLAGGNGAAGEGVVLTAAGKLWQTLGKPAGQSPFSASAPVAVKPQLEVHDLAAVLIGLGPDNVAELGRVREELQSAVTGWPTEAQTLALQAAQALATIESGTASDPEEALGEALAALGQITEALTGTTDNLAEASPAPSVPADAPSPPPPASPPAAEALPCLEFDGDPELLSEFVVESLDHLLKAENSLLALELNPEDQEAINAVYRGFHTIKGTAGFLGLREIQQLAHQAENLLDRVRKHELQLCGSTADLALESADMLKQMVSDLQDSPPGEICPGPEGLEELLARLDGFGECQPEASGLDATLEPPRLGDILVNQGQTERQAIEQVASRQGERRLGEALVQEGAARSPEVGQALRVQRQTRESNEQNVRVRTDRLDALINMVGELVIANAMLNQDQDVQALQHRSLGRKVSQLAKITRELQGLTMSMRMVPLRATFQKMARAVRDVARKAGKEVNLVTEGEDTEIDRNMVESLSDPLLHMVRNAVDHGLEAPAVRVELGKPPMGTLQLRAYHEAGNVVIEMADDGQGLDRERILAKAVANGVVTEEKELSDEEVYRLIFAAGLSTAERVTDVSGRGVGMDVVRRNIEALRGRIDLTSQRGQGTTFSLRIPLTLAIIDGMLLRVGSERYILPTVCIQESVRGGDQMVSTVTERGEMVAFRGQLVPIVRLNELFGVPGGAGEVAQGLLVIVESGGEMCALLVDELLGQQQVVIKSLSGRLGHIPGLAGASILGDGRVGLILDVGGLLQLARGESTVLGSPATNAA